MRVGFYAWNPFQIYQVEAIARHLPDAEYILERRRNIDFDRVFTREFLASLNAPVRYIARGDAAQMDRRYDVVVCQTSFPGMEELKRAKIAAMQYSMSKERHQYGAWRALCDLNLVYGRYSLDRIAPLSPCVMVGNPRFDRWFENGLDPVKAAKLKESLDPAKKTLLYLPTWGGLSSIEAFGREIAGLSKDYNVIAKVHHKTDTHELNKKNILSEEGIARTFGASDDLLYLLSAADVVMSDYSGAIFDAINAGKPVVLLQRLPETLVGSEKFGLESIEYAQRHRIGPVVSEPGLLRQAIGDVVTGNTDYTLANAALRQECFAQQGGSGLAAAKALENAAEASDNRPHYQLYLRDSLREGRKEAETLRQLRSTNPAHIARKALDLGRKRLAPLQGAALKGTRIWNRGAEEAVSFTLNLLWKNPEAAAGKIGFLRHLLFSAALKNLAERYDAKDTKGLALAFARLSFEKSRATGLAPYIRMLSKYGRPEDMTALIDRLLALPPDIQNRVLSRLERAQEAAKTRAEDVRRARARAYKEVTEKLSVPAGKTATARNLRILTTNRWLEDARRLLPGLNIDGATREHALKSIAQAQSRLKHWHVLAEAANANHAPGLAAGDFFCFFDGKIAPFSSSGATRALEFFLPPYFFEDSVTNPETHDSICALLRHILDTIAEAGIAIVPRHQFRLNDASPSGHWPALSYHTTGTRADWLHIKDGHIPGYFSMDPGGYSGWSSIAKLESLPPAALAAPSTAVEKTWQKLQKDFVQSKVSKYKQQQAAFEPPARPYVFLPLQVVGDTVATHARLDGPELALALADLLPRAGYALVIKRHPMDKNRNITAFLKKLRSRPHVHVTEASIHDILPGAAAVATVNSGTGFEALLHGKRVILSGAADYAVAADRVSCPQDIEKIIPSLSDPPDIEKTRRFLHYYVTEYTFHYEDKAALRGRIEALCETEIVPHRERA